MLEHRWNPRISTEIAVVIKSAAGEEIRGIVRNASAGGIFVEAKASLPVNAYVKIRFRTASYHPQRWIGAIVAHNNGGIGLITDFPITEYLDLSNRKAVNGRRSYQALWQASARSAAPKL